MRKPKLMFHLGTVFLCWVQISFEWGPKSIKENPKYKLDTSTRKRDLFHDFTLSANVGHLPDIKRQYYYDPANYSRHEEFESEICDAVIDGSKLYTNKTDMLGLSVNGTKSVTVTEVLNVTDVIIYWECARSASCNLEAYSCDTIYTTIAAIFFFVFFTALICVLCWVCRDIWLRSHPRQVAPTNPVVPFYNTHDRIRIVDHMLLKDPNVFPHISPVPIHTLAMSKIDPKTNKKLTKTNQTDNQTLDSSNGDDRPMPWAVDELENLEPTGETTQPEPANVEVEEPLPNLPVVSSDKKPVDLPPLTSPTVPRLEWNASLSERSITSSSDSEASQSDDEQSDQTGRTPKQFRKETENEGAKTSERAFDD